MGGYAKYQQTVAVSTGGIQPHPIHVNEAQVIKYTGKVFVCVFVDF